MKVNAPSAPMPLADDSHLSPEDSQKLRDVARQFEAVFVNQMVGAMRKTVQPGGLIPQSQAEKMYQSMLDQEHAAAMAQSDQFGLSQMIYEHLLRSSTGR